MSRDEQFDDLLNGLKTLPRAEAPPFLFTRILNKANDTGGRLQQRVPALKLAWIAAAFAGLFFLNLSILRHSGREQHPLTQSQSSGNDFALTDTHFQLY